MIVMHRLRIVALAGLVFLLGMSGTASAQKKKVAEANEEQAAAQKGQDIKDLVLAYQLRDLGRKNKAPEALITAASLFRKVSRVPMTAIEQKPEIEVANDSQAAPLDQVLAPPDYAKEADALFDEALALGASLKLNLDPLIHHAKNRTVYRSPATGPQHVTRMIGGGQTQAFRFKLIANQPTHFGFRATVPMRITVVQANNEAVWVDSFIAVGHTTWYPAHHVSPKAAKKGPPSVPIAIRISNIAQPPAQFQFWLN